MNISLNDIESFLTYAEILAAISASVFYYKYKNTPIKYILIILWLVVFTEQLSVLMFKKMFWMYDDANNFWLYNIMYPTWKIIYLLIYTKALQNIIFKKWVKRFIIIYLIAICFNWLFLENFLTDLESYSQIVGCLFITISAIFYLIELLRSDKIIVYHKKLLFWISIGLMIFYSGSIPFIIMRSFYYELEYIPNVFIVNYILSSIMNLLFTFGFIWSKKE